MSGLLLPFDTDDPEFVRGFEAGRLWAVLSASPEEEFEEYVRLENLEMALRLAEATGRTVITEDVDEIRVMATFGRAAAEETPDA